MKHVKRRRKLRKKVRPRAAPLSLAQVLAWADAHHRWTGRWPRRDSRTVCGGVGEKWANIDQALRKGLRGLEGKSSLARLLAQHRGVRNRKELPRLTHKLILAWADAFHRRTGCWPNGRCGAVADAPGETWTGIVVAMHAGQRGLPRGTTLAHLLETQRGVRNIQNLAQLSYRQVLAWADAWRRRTGRWPHVLSGPIPEARGETWCSVNKCMNLGLRGLPGAYSLARLLSDRRGVRNVGRLPGLAHEQVLAWADQFRRVHGKWPGKKSGPIRGSVAGETWQTVETALYRGSRGFPGGTTLKQFLERHRAGRRP
jgi:hypothetical protein